MRNKSKTVKVSTLISIFVVVVLAISALVVSGKFESILTPFSPLLNTFASRSKPKLTQSFVDAFKSDAINQEKWTVRKNGDVNVLQTSSNNLRFDIPAGSVADKVKQGSLTFKQDIGEKDDFRFSTVLYKPLVTGEGTGVSGIRFASDGATDEEGATIQWRVNGSSSKVSFYVTSADGKRIESQQDDVSSNIAVLRLERVNKKYRAYYKTGSDEAGDVGWKMLGEERNASLGGSGKVSIFSTNTGSAGKFPRVVGRFDYARFSWEGVASVIDKVGFADYFADGVVSSKWKANLSKGSSYRETKTDNLVINVRAGQVDGKNGRVLLTRNDPVVKEGKDFTVQSVVYKPTINGEGDGTSGLVFVSTGSTNDEVATVKWITGQSGNKLVFLTRNPDGSLSERSSVNVDKDKLTLRLVRRGTKYSAYYRQGDSDTEFVKIGEDENASFGADGVVGLSVNNLGVANKYPRVTARFDQVSGSFGK